MIQIPEKKIYIEQLEEMFSNIKSDTDWDTSGDMLWGYFFTNSDPAKLETVKELLVSQGYRFVDIHLADKNEPNDSDIYWLHVEKVETHSPKSLDEINDKFYTLAHEFALDSYDGMDIGPVGKEGF